ncbi:MAG: flavin reductase [Firmicutes bacterium HGW-Firmicutes-15]|nr:MAG: flavin reductase [Firmicutes bacterium HGW-Firmicutes-15]
MPQKLAYEEYSQQFLNQLPKGAFLTVKEGNRLNTMTIGWGSIGYIWAKPMLMVMVRQSRYTHDLIKEAQDFSVSVPALGELKKPLTAAGTKSGRDIDKFKECDLTAQKAKCIESPVIKECDLIFECQLVFKQVMEPETLDNAICGKFYSDNDFHIMYYGEILACYQQD